MINPVILLWINLIVQAIALLVSLRYLKRVTTVDIGNLLAVQHLDSPGGGWKSDPLTEALTDLRNAKSRIEDLVEEVKDLKDTVGDEYITRKEFQPVQRVVYGMVAVILTTAVLSMLFLIWKGVGH